MRGPNSTLLRTVVFVLAAFIVAESLVGCGGPSARIRDKDEPSLVGTRRAGASVYRNVVDGALKKLSERYRGETRSQDTVTKIRMAFVGVENATTEELGSWRDQINAIINESINYAGDFIDISFERFIKPAMREAGVTSAQLGSLPRSQRAVAQVLEQNGKPIECLLFAKITQGNTRAGNLKQSDYILTMELVNISTGRALIASDEISKEYSR